MAVNLFYLDDVISFQGYPIFFFFWFSVKSKNRFFIFKVAQKIINKKYSVATFNNFKEFLEFVQNIRRLTYLKNLRRKCGF